MSSSKIDITFVLPSLVAGGAERVMSLVAKNLDQNQFNTTLIVIGFEKDKAYNIDGINVIYLNRSRVLNGIPQLFFYVIKNRPSIVVSCMAHLNTTMASILLPFPKIRLVTREANIKKVTELYHLHQKSFFGNLLKKLTSKRTNAIICQSTDMANELITDYKGDPSKITVINNPISDEFTLKLTQQKNEITHYITVGRLHEEKGHLRLLDILSKLKHPFHYTIIGVGDWKDEIINQINKLQLKPFVTIIDYTKEVPKYLVQSDVFLQGSFAEGFPNALLESCAVGTPVVAYNAPGGTNEIIEHGINGYLADNDEEFLLFLNKLKEKPLQNETVSQSVFKKFSKEKIVSQYEELFKKVAN